MSWKSLEYNTAIIACIGAIGVLFYPDIRYGDDILLTALGGAIGIVLLIQGHEFGHFVFAKIFGLNPVNIPLHQLLRYQSGYGITLSVVKYDVPKTLGQLAVISAAGPLFNLLIGLLSLAIYKAFAATFIGWLFYGIMAGSFGFFILNFFLFGEGFKWIRARRFYRKNNSH